MSFGMVAASYLTVTSLLPDPLLSFGFNEGSGNNFYPTHGSANGYAFGMEWGASLAGHGSAAVRTGQANGDMTLRIEGVQLSPSIETWTALSAMCWYRPMEIPYNASRVPFVLYDADEMGWLGIAQDSDGHLEAWLGDENTAFTANPIDNDIWAHLALVWDGSTLLFYIDGVVVESRSTTEATKDLYYARLNGANWSHSGGSIDDFRLFNVALTPEQITEFMATGV